MTALREIADQTFARMGKEHGVPPEIEVQLRATLGGGYHHLGDCKKAETMHRDTLPRMRQWLGNEHLKIHCPEIDKPIAALLRDLEQRGLLDETLVVWAASSVARRWCKARATDAIIIRRASPIGWRAAAA